MKLLTKEQQKSYENAKFCCISKENFEYIYAKHKKCYKVKDHCYCAGEYGDAAYSISKLCLRETHNASQLTVFFFFFSFFSFFCHLYLGLWNCKSVSLVPNMADRGGEYSFFQSNVRTYVKLISLFL